MRHPFYILFGLLLVGTSGWVQYRGWGGSLSVDEVRGVPKSIRDNPGAYRSHYRSSPRYYGGK
jgi:hypothetical protein